MNTKKQLLVVIEAVQMNGAVKGWLGYLDAIDKSEWDIDVFLFDSDRHDGLELPEYVRRLPDDIHCVIERVGVWRALQYTLTRGRIDLALKRLWYSVMQRRNPRFRKWNLMKPAKMQPKHYDVAIGSSQGVSWEYVATKVSADVKLAWVDTDVSVGWWRVVWDYFKKYMDKLSGVVCVSKAMRDKMRVNNPHWADKIFAMNYVIDEEAIVRKGDEACPFPKTDKLRLITVGRYSPEKGQHLIPAMAQGLKKKGIDFEWYVIAPGSSSQKEVIDKDVNARGVAENVIVTEGMANPFPMVKSADIAVQPSSFEGFGLTVSEAMILGTYVVASDIPSFREQITSPGLGLFSKAVDVDSFVVAILEGIHVVRAGAVTKEFHSPYNRANTYRQFTEIIESSRRKEK